MRHPIYFHYSAFEYFECCLCKVVVDEELIATVLGPARYSWDDPRQRVAGAGSAAGLVWTAAGGQVVIADYRQERQAVSSVTNIDAGNQTCHAYSAVSGSSRLPAVVSKHALQQRTLPNLQVQYVECIATGRRRNGYPGSLTLTGQVRCLLVLCK